MLDMVAPFRGKTTMWEGVPNGLADIVLFFLMPNIIKLKVMQHKLFVVTKIFKNKCTKIFWS